MLKLTQEPENSGPYEDCCFCQKPTNLWFTPKDVAVCRSCGDDHEPEDVPSKEEWIRQAQMKSGETRVT